MPARSSSRRTGRDEARPFRRILFIAALLIALGAAAYSGFQGFMTWRARDLAAKAKENLDRRNYRMAWIQINSAQSMRPADLEVIRLAAMIQAELGLASSVDLWERLAAAGQLQPGDLELRARAAARFGTEDQFARATSDLEASGDASAAGKLRAGRGLLRGDLDRAIEEARRLAEARDDKAMRLDVAKLLFQRHADRLANPANPGYAEIQDQITGLVNSLMDTPQEPEALAFALGVLRSDTSQQIEWADRAMQNLRADNPALLPAAAAMVALGKSTPSDLQRRLRPVFDAAPLERRAAFAMWLTGQGLPREALTLITAQEAAESPEAFAARVEALARTENWNGVLETASVNGRAPAAVRLAAKARAEYALGRGEQSGARSVADALRAAAREGGFSALMLQFDAIGAGGAVDNMLVETCGDPRLADSVFRAARDRFSRRGAQADGLLAAAYQRAAAAAPNASSVVAYGRYRQLIEDVGRNGLGRPGAIASPVVDPQLTAKAVQAAPNDEAVRATHALALIQAGRGAESLGVFQDITIFFGRLPPPMQAVLVAAAAASSEPGVAFEMRKRIAVDALSTEERLLLPAAGPR